MRRGNEEEVFEKHIVHQNLKLTQERRAILRAFLEAERHVTAEELHHHVKRINRSIGIATVYRTLNLLCECGLAEQHQFGDAHTRYEPVYNVNHHDHLICTGCGKIIEFENERIEVLQEEVARKNSFRVFKHKLEMYGRCWDCAKNPSGASSNRKILSRPPNSAYF